MTNRRAQRRNQKPRFVRKLGPNDVFQVGRALLIIPGLDDAWPPEVKNAVDRRRRANLYGPLRLRRPLGEPAPRRARHAARHLRARGRLPTP